MQQDKQYLEEDDNTGTSHEEQEENNQQEETDYSSLDRHELYQKIHELGEEEDIFSAKPLFEKAVAAYKAIVDEEFQAGRDKYVAEGGLPEDYVGVSNPVDQKVEEADKAFHKKLYETRKKKEREQQENLTLRNALLEELKELTDKAGDMSQRFQQWHDIQSRWRNAGTVPAANRSELYNNYRHYNNLFFSQVQLSREFRELDLKKNVELRQELINEARALVENAEVGKALREYNRLLQRWKDTGPVPAGEKEQLWNEFGKAGDAIHEKRRLALEEREKQKERNLEKKKALVARMEKLTEDIPSDYKGLTERLNDAEKLFEEWKTIGYVPESDNGRTWKSFRNLRGVLFRERDAYYARRRETMSENLRQKTELCEKAESLKDSTDWINTGRQLKKLQDAWKKTGPVSKKHSDKIWKRFRGACDAFFNARDAAKGAKEEALKENVAKKEAFLKEQESFSVSGEAREMISQINELKKSWSAFGEVPHVESQRLEKEFSALLNKLYDQVREVTKEDPALFQKIQYEQVMNSPGGEQKLIREKRQLQEKIKKLEAQVIQFENNLGFFSGSKNNPMVQELQGKIDKEKEELEALKKKLNRMPV